MGMGKGHRFVIRREDHIIDLRMLLRLTDQQPVPFYCQLRPVHLVTVWRHLPCGDFDSTLRARYPSPEYPAVGIYHSRALKFLELLWHPQYKCAGLAFHRVGPSKVIREAIPPEEADQDFYQVLQSVGVSGTNHAIIGVKDSQAAPEGLSHPVGEQPLIFHRNGQPRPNNVVHDDIE